MTDAPSSPRHAEVRGQMTEGRGQMIEFGSRTRRRPIGQDYAAAKDAEVGGQMTEDGRRRSEDG
jgi:hypothetical protein